MSKGLEALERIKNEKPQYFSTLYDSDMWEEDFDIIEKALERLEELEEEKQSFDRVIEKKLKALEIIKEKNVDVGAIKDCVNAYAYNDFKALTETFLIKRKELTQDEFDLLKEVLL